MSHWKRLPESCNVSDICYVSLIAPCSAAGEMMVGPAKVLFLDEISTGLDSSTTFLIVKCIRNAVKAMRVGLSCVNNPTSLQQACLDLSGCFVASALHVSRCPSNVLRNIADAQPCRRPI